MEAAHEFLVDVIGCDFIYELGPKQAEDDWMQVHLGVHPDTVIRAIRFYRLRNGANFEVFHYEPADLPGPPLRNSDPGGHHIALYVDDIDEAIQYLRSKNVEIMGEPSPSSEAAQGQKWVYFRSPWGLQFELVSYPQGKAYEQGAERLLWHPAHPVRD
ncbi:VOC family protein [Brevibacterium sp. UCMA 11754]|nr:VOC family protein [Brevibacterium sp. UCMA 11754]